MRSGPLRFERQLGGHLVPAVADLAEHTRIRDEHRIEDHFVEVVRTGHQDDRFDANAVGIAGDEELAESVVSVFRILRAGPGEHDHLMGMMGPTGPDLGAGEEPTPIRANGLRLRGGQIRAGFVLAHADRRIQLACHDLREEAFALVLGAVGQQAGRHLAVGDPVRPDRSAGRDELLGHHVTVQMPHFVSAVLLGDGQPEEAGSTQAGGEVLVPAGHPRVDQRRPAELGAVGPQKVPYGQASLDQFGFSGTQFVV